MYVLICMYWCTSATVAEVYDYSMCCYLNEHLITLRLRSKEVVVILRDVCMTC